MPINYKYKTVLPKYNDANCVYKALEFFKSAYKTSYGQHENILYKCCGARAYA